MSQKLQGIKSAFAPTVRLKVGHIHEVNVRVTGREDRDGLDMARKSSGNS